MKSVLVIINTGPLAGQNLLEALSATMVLATFGLEVQVCLTGDGVQLLQPPHASTGKLGYFKSAYQLLESFEYYDLLPVWVAVNTDVDVLDTSLSTILANSPIEHQAVSLCPKRLNQFDQVLHW